MTERAAAGPFASVAPAAPRPPAGADVRLRPATPADGGGLAAIYGPVVRDTAISFELDPPDATEMGERVARILETHPWIVATAADDPVRVLGYAYATRFRGRAAYDWTTEVSVYRHEDARGRGVAAALYGGLFDLAARQGFRTIVAGITLPNEPSERFHERMGFRRVGEVRRAGWKFGRWHDVAFLDRAVSAGPADAAPPARLRPVAEVLAEWVEEQPARPAESQSAEPPSEPPSDPGA